MLIPIEVSVGVGDGILLSPFGVCPWAGDLTLMGVFSETRETVLMELSGPLRRMAVLLRVGSVMALELGENGIV